MTCTHKYTYAYVHIFYAHTHTSNIGGVGGKHESGPAVETVPSKPQDECAEGHEGGGGWRHIYSLSNTSNVSKDNLSKDSLSTLSEDSHKYVSG